MDFVTNSKDKTFGEKKYTYLYKNKFNKKKQKYQNHRNKSSLNKPVRKYVKSFFNKNIYNPVKLQYFIFPSKIQYTYTWWDCTPLKPKVFKLYI